MNGPSADTGFSRMPVFKNNILTNLGKTLVWFFQERETWHTYKLQQATYYIARGLPGCEKEKAKNYTQALAYPVYLDIVNGGFLQETWSVPRYSIEFICVWCRKLRDAHKNRNVKGSAVERVEGAACLKPKNGGGMDPSLPVRAFSLQILPIILERTGRCFQASGWLSGAEAQERIVAVGVGVFLVVAPACILFEQRYLRYQLNHGVIFGL